MEFTQWLYSNEYNLAECTDLLEWAIDLLMFKVKGEKPAVTRTISASTAHSRSGKASKMKLHRQKVPTSQANHPALIIVPESLNEEEITGKAIINQDHLLTDMSTIERSMATQFQVALKFN